MSGVCRDCIRYAARQREFNKLSDERKAERTLHQQLAEQGLRHCACGENCITPGGPNLPATTEYFRPKTGGRLGLYYQCRKCERELEQRKSHPNNYNQWITSRLEHKKPVPEGYKRCSCLSDCIHPEGPTLPATLEYFEARVETSDGLRDQCRKCLSYRSRQSLHNDPVRLEHERQYQREYSKRPDQLRKAREWANRPEQIEKRNARRRVYLQTQRGKAVVAAYTHRREARKLNLPNTFTVEDYDYALAYFNGFCPVCEYPLADLFGKRKPHADHWIPLNSPNCIGTVPANMVILCSECNLSKWANDPLEWLIERYGKRKAAKINQRIQAFFATVRQD